MNRHLPWRRLHTALLPLIVLLNVGCASSPYVGEYDFTSLPGTDFAAYRYFKWLDEESSFTRTAIVADDRGDANEVLLRETIEKSLVAKGFARATDTPPDFYYAYRAAVFDAVNSEIVDKNAKRQREEQLRERNEAAASHNDFDFSRATLYSGTLRLLVIDADSRETVWSGTDSKFVETFRGSQSGGRLSVRGLLEAFPPLP